MILHLHAAFYRQKEPRPGEAPFTVRSLIIRSNGQITQVLVHILNDPIANTFRNPLLHAFIQQICTFCGVTQKAAFHPDARIRAELEKRFGSATIILISHRITTLSRADRVLVMDRGRVAQFGTPAELSAQPGLYRQIEEIQTLDRKEVTPA